MTYELIIRNGTIVDGLGGQPYVGDGAISDGVIAAVGEVDGSGTREIDATGLLVTPGFIDLHTHYDGQAIWSDRMTPSPAHGVTTAVMAHCGVGFATCRAAAPAWGLGPLPRVPRSGGVAKPRYRRRPLPAALSAAGLCDGPARRRPRT